MKKTNHPERPENKGRVRVEMPNTGGLDDIYALDGSTSDVPDGLDDVEMNHDTGKPTNKKKAKDESDAKDPTPDEDGLHGLFVEELKDIYWAEKALTNAIPKMIEKATSPELVRALSDHLGVTERQVTRCEEVFAALGIEASENKCEAMHGLIKEADEIMKSAPEGSVRDAAIISAAQKVEHYEIASYGTLCAFAKQLGEQEAANLLDQTLQEEKEADSTLTNVAEHSVNEAAVC